MACGTDPSTAPNDAGTEAGGGGCHAGEAELDGVCVPAGVTSCASGFEPDGDGGCRAVLPASPCGPGELAVPGDGACHVVAPCPSTDWPELPAEALAAAQYVDASYTGGDSDGSMRRPWTTLIEGIEAASAGAVVALAAGTYQGPFRTAERPVRIWGACPERVELTTEGDDPTLFVLSNADGSEVRSLSISGKYPLAVTGSKAVLLEGLWLHDSEAPALAVVDALGESEVLLRGSLVESARQIGVLVAGATLSVESSVVRGTRATLAGQGGVGITAIASPADGVPSVLSIRSSVIEQNTATGVAVLGSEATLVGTLVRDTQPQPADGKFGEAVVVVPDADFDVPTRATLEGCVLERNLEASLLVSDAEATVTETTVRDSRPELALGERGFGVAVQRSPQGSRPAHLTLRASTVLDSDLVGVFVGDATAEVDRVLVRRTSPTSGSEDGDGFVVVNYGRGAEAVLTASRIEQSGRAGASSFSAILRLGSSAFECNAFHLDGEPAPAGPFEITNLGGNACGCEGESVECQVLSAGLTPPATPE